jgi:hypothetical protein
MNPSSSMSRRKPGNLGYLYYYISGTFAASCSVMVSVRSNDLPQSRQRGW